MIPQKFKEKFSIEGIKDDKLYIAYNYEQERFKLQIMSFINKRFLCKETRKIVDLDEYSSNVNDITGLYEHVKEYSDQDCVKIAINQGKDLSMNYIYDKYINYQKYITCIDKYLDTIECHEKSIRKQFKNPEIFCFDTRKDKALSHIYHYIDEANH